MKDNNGEDCYKDGSEMKKDKVENDFLEKINKDKIESFQDEKFTYRKRSYQKWIIQIVIIAVAIAAVYLLMNPKIEVIDFSYMSFNDASAWANDSEVIVTANYTYSDGYEREQVISQNIDPGMKVKEGTNIILMVSDGVDPYESIELPEFDSSWNRQSILRWLDNNYMENYRIIEIHSEEIPGNYLISYRLIGTDERSFNRSSEVEFLISEVREITTLEMTNFLNSTVLAVDTWAKAHQVDYTVSHEHSDVYEVGRVMEQSIMPGVNFDVSETISFLVSSGPETEVIYMPDFLNHTISDIDAWAKQNNIDCLYEYDFNSIYAKDTIMYQSIKANEEINEGQRLQIVISRGNGTTVPSFKNIDIEDAADHLQDHGIYVYVTEVYKGGTEAGELIFQSKPAGSVVEEGTDIEVTYSLGDTVVVPRFIDQLKIEFEEWLMEINELGADISLTVIEESDFDHEYGTIMSQSVYNERVVLSSDITVTVSSGNARIVPSFENIMIREVNDYADMFGLHVIIDERYENETNPGDFLSQSISEGTKVHQGTTVKVEYSLGDEIFVPDFADQLFSDIKNWIDDANDVGANLSLKVYEKYSSDTEYGRIISQEDFNEFIALDSEVKILLSLGEAYEVIDFSAWKRNSLEYYANIHELNIVFETVSNSGLASGSFISQYPAQGEIISKKDFIVIQIAE